MRIYNEIVFDVDGKVIYEDSYEYSGELMLCQDIPDLSTIPDMNEDGTIDVRDIQQWIIQQREAGTSQEQIEETTTGVANVVTGGKSSEYLASEDKSGFVQDLKMELQAQAMKAQTQAQDVQLNPLPSLPSISNIGSVAPTGIINWNAIPGGFQPLPQVAGGKKKLYQLSKFHGGVNQKSSARDISDTECQEATNVAVSQVGKIKLLGHIKNTDNSITVQEPIDDRGSPGYGLFQFTAPAATDDTVGEHVITLSGSGEQLDAHNVIGGSATLVDNWIGYDGTNDHDVAHVIYAAGNGVYANDANFAHTDNPARAKVYVYREDQNETVSGWVADGHPMINSPTTDNEAATPASNVGIQDADVDASLHGALEVCIVPTGTGTWDGEYFFYVSWLFDGGCETGLTGIGTDTFDEDTLRFNPSLCHTNAAPLGGDKRIEGARVYFKEAGTSERYLLAELSTIEGVKGALDSTFIPWTISANVGSDANEDVHDLVDASRIVFTDPPTVYTYSSLNGYYANEVYVKSPDLDQDDTTGGTATAGPTAHLLRYKSAVVGSGGIVFVGNVKFKGKHMPDSMMFSMPGKPGVFPQYNRFDSPSSDGSPIIALASFRDTILQFKQNSMYVIDVSNPAQFYAKAIFRDCGVFNPCQVFTTSFGVIFVNKNGCFIYDGQKVISLSSGKIPNDSNGWHDGGVLADEGSVVNAIGSAAKDAVGVPCVGYDPRSQNIIVLKDINDDSTDIYSWVYNMPTQSWAEGCSQITNSNGSRHTNFIITSGGYLSILSDDAETLFNYNHDKTSDTDDQTITYITKDFDFGFPSQSKKIFKVYVTYFSDDSTIPVMTYGANGAAPTTAFDNGVFGTGGSIATTAWSVNDTALTGIFSLALKITGATDHSFEIQDISILYRARPIK